MITTTPAERTVGALDRRRRHLDRQLRVATVGEIISARLPMLMRLRSVRQRMMGSPRSRRSPSSTRLTMSPSRLPVASSRHRAGQFLCRRVHIVDVDRPMSDGNDPLTDRFERKLRLSLTPPKRRLDALAIADILRDRQNRRFAAVVDRTRCFASTQIPRSPPLISCTSYTSRRFVLPPGDRRSALRNDVFGTRAEPGPSR